jgi:transcriptional regulator with XRE-family HTH domain
MAKKTDFGVSSQTNSAQFHAGSRNDLKGVDVGTRVRALRLRYGLSLREVSRRTGLDYGFLGRLERGGTAVVQQLKPGIVHTVLDEIEVTEQERRAVFYREGPPLAAEWIREEVSKVAAKIEEGHRPVALLDEHLSWLYLNRSGRLLFGLTGEEYVQLLGSPMLLDLVNPSAPLYSRYSDEMRRIYFSWKVTSFKLRFAEQQFCKWYLDLEASISNVAWAWRIWNKPQVLPTLVDSHETTMLHPEVGEMHLRDQLNVQTLSSRFLIMEWAPTDEVSAAKAAAVVSRPYWLPPLDADSTTTPGQDTDLANTPTTPATSHMERRARESSPSKRQPDKGRNRPPAGEVEPKTFAEGAVQEETRPRPRSRKKELVH